MQDTAKQCLAILRDGGETAATVEALYTLAETFLTAKRKGNCPIERVALLRVRTVIACGLWPFIVDKEYGGLVDPEAKIQAVWCDIREHLESAVEGDGSLVLLRERERWINHWKGLYPRCDKTERAKIRRLAKRRYPDHTVDWKSLR
jgi:hypothetical protein